MADKGDEDETVMLRHPLTDSHKQEIPRPPSQGIKNGITTRKRRESERRERKSHVTIPMENFAFESSQHDFLVKSDSTSSNKLHNAVAKSCYEECKTLLDKGIGVNSIDQVDGSTALHSLAKKAHKGNNQTLNIALLLIKRGALVDALDSKKNTPLHIAAREGLDGLCEVLINQANATKKSLVNCLNEKRMTALHLAAQEGQCEVIEFLLRQGAEPNMKDSRSWFPLHYAVDKGCVTCCRALAPYYQGDAALTKKQEPLLMVAARKGHYNVCKELPAAILDINYQDKDKNTALHIVAKNGFVKFVVFLLDLGASPDLLDSNGCTPLMAAVAKDKEKCVAVLAERGASLTMKNIYERNILHIAAYSKSNKCMAYLLKYSDFKKIINEKEKEGLTPLFLAVQKKSNYCRQLLEAAGASTHCGNEEKASLIYFSPSYRGSIVVQDMLTQEKNVNLENEDKLTPLHIGAREGSTEACKSLLRKGARINASDKAGRTPLHWASHYGHENAIKFLLKNGASKRAKDDKKFTALHWAAFGGKLECCKVLLHTDRGLMKEMDKRGKYALDIAFQQGRSEVFTFLLKNFSQRAVEIPEKLAERFHSYVHTMLNGKKRSLLEAVIRSNWWEVGFGAAKSKMHGEAPCPLFRDIIKVFPDLAHIIMSKCHSKHNFRLLEDNYCMLETKETLDTSNKRKTRESLQMSGEETTTTIVRNELYWKLHHPVSIMVSREFLPLLQHPLMKAWLNFKWRAYALWIFCFLMAIRAFSIVVLVWLLNSIKNSLQLKKKSEELSSHSLAVSPTELLLMAISILVQVLVDINSWCRLRSENNIVLVLVRLASILLALLTFVFASRCSDTCDETVYVVGIPALVLAGLHFIFIIDQLPFVNLLTSITRDFLYKYLKGLVCVTCIISLFAFIFHLLLCEEKQFETMAHSVLSIALWQMGDFNQEMFFEVKTFRVFLHILFITYLITFGALIVTIIKAPSISRETSKLNKEIGTINLLFEIDVCFPYLRKVCKENQSDNKNKPRIWTQLTQKLGLRKTCEETENETSVDETTVFMLGSRCQRCRTFKGNEESESRMHDLLLGRLDGLSQDMKNLQSQIRLLQTSHH